MDYKEKFMTGMDAETYCGILGENKALHDHYYKRADVDADHSRLASGLSRKLNVIVLTEPWCGDSVAVVPVLLRLVEGKTVPVRSRS